MNSSLDSIDLQAQVPFKQLYLSGWKMSVVAISGNHSIYWRALFTWFSWQKLWGKLYLSFRCLPCFDICWGWLTEVWKPSRPGHMKNNRQFFYVIRYFNMAAEFYKEHAESSTVVLQHALTVKKLQKGSNKHHLPAITLQWLPRYCFNLFYF